LTRICILGISITHCYFQILETHIYISGRCPAKGDAHHCKILKAKRGDGEEIIIYIINK